MADTGFSAADFTIVPEGDMLPFPTEDEQGFTRYRATVMLPSRTQLNTLLDYKAIISILPALGGGGTVVIVNGQTRTLTYPAQNGTEHSQSAILVRCDPHVRMLHSTHILADCEWILTG